jgi:hypothetical protein
MLVIDGDVEPFTAARTGQVVTDGNNDVDARVM